jgi:hypothetical protein
MSWFHLWLFLHVTAAIVAFGPTFALPLVGALGRDNPTHMSFALRVIGTLERKLIIPFVMTMPVSGVLLAISVSIEWNHNPWLIAALAVYAVALTFALGVQRPVIEKLIDMTSGAGAPAAVPAGPGAAVAGPPPAFLALVKRMQMGGMALTVAFFVIMFLMIWKPGGNI